MPLKAIRERARALRSLSADKVAAFRASQAGRSMRALTLARGGEDWTEALTANYLKVRIAGRWPANVWRETTIGQNEDKNSSEPANSALENHLSERDISAVGER